MDYPNYFAHHVPSEQQFSVHILPIVVCAVVAALFVGILLVKKRKHNQKDQ